MAKRGKRYEAAAAKIDSDKVYSPTEAMTLIKETTTVSFDPTVEVALRLGVDPRKADQMVRGSVILPSGTGKTNRVAVFAEGPKATEASEAGADIVGSDTLVEMIEAGNLDFDVVIATPDQMGKVGRFGKVLGPRGLMPNPKTGTVTMDVAKAVNDAKGGKIDFRVDRQGNVHAVIGKASFSAKDLWANYNALVEELQRLRPASAKGRYIRSIAASTSQGPSIRVEPRSRDEWEADGAVASEAAATA
ncbi:LSU ribosomal protein L1p (L10Ae) [Euzebya pacifica]|jgi:large subunit ribosomal protein L1|uniref:Large ribosomal subunit protein uL1 n=1 Tax=Euzebya pacifica TaxID=1608957 RepID=A0A346Y3Y4_9ACTN|nr:50S ribosomal protein L1 [Euzebya pacifica]AXV09181.1 LSU ribosomal protein L1p (L10Ae) [Euzebya pacifica]